MNCYENQSKHLIIYMQNIYKHFSIRISEQELRTELKHTVKAIIDELLQPERYGLQAR